MTTTFKWVALGAVLGFFAATGVSCGPAKCTPSNCAFGCCDSAGSCQNGSSDAQCGGGGRACASCVLGQTCQLGSCLAVGSGGGFGGGNGGGAQGGGTATGGGTGGGTATGGGTGGGTATGGGTGGGTATGGGTGGGTATGGGTGGGTATGGGTGGGTATGGGTGGGTACSGLGTAYTTFMAGRSVCTNGSQSLSASSSLASQCTSSCSGGNDPVGINGLTTCLSTAPTCTTGNETSALNAFGACASPVVPGLSSSCQAVLFALASGTGGGTGGGTPTGGGTGGGTPTGGGTGGGGTSGGCAVPSNCTFISWVGAAASAGYTNGANYEFTSGETHNSATDPFDAIGAEIIWKIGTTPTNVTVPGSRNLALEGTYFTCNYCSTMAEACTASGCTGRRFLARAGTMSVSSASRAATGTLAVTLSNLCFEEWNLSTDVGVPGGACVVVQSASVNTSF